MNAVTRILKPQEVHMPLHFNCILSSEAGS